MGTNEKTQVMTECWENHEPVHSEEEERRVNLLGLDEMVEEVDQEGRSRKLEIASRSAVVSTSGRGGALLAESGSGGVPPACARVQGRRLARRSLLAACRSVDRWGPRLRAAGLLCC